MLLQANFNNQRIHGYSRMNILQTKIVAKKIALIVALTALCVSTSYIMSAVPNINLMDLLVFVTGFSFGSYVGASVAMLSWIVYGVINPLGFNIVILISCIIGEMIFGVVGGIIRNSAKLDKPNNLHIEFGILGLVLSTTYDLITNTVYARIFNLPIITAIVSGWLLPPWFGIIHEVSNLILFSVIALPLVKAMLKIKERTIIV